VQSKERHVPSAAGAQLFAECPALQMRAHAYAITLDDYRKRFETDHPLTLFPPPVLSAAVDSRRGLPSTCAAPFLTSIAGSLPHGPPSCIDECLGTYLVSGASKAPPNIDVDFEPIEVASNGDARRALAQAAAQGHTFWAAINTPTVEHPAWWPRHAEPVPGFEHMIIGSGDAGIGMHRDRYLGDGSERLVSTYLALGRGRKHVLLLPPTDVGGHLAEELGGAGCDDTYGRHVSQRTKLPVRPPPETLEKVLAAGGYWFDLEASVVSDVGVHARARGLGSDGESDGSSSTEGEEEVLPLCLFIPSGWWHWLAGDAEWHVAWSGSFFPGSDRASRPHSARDRKGAESGRQRKDKTRKRHTPQHSAR
jgi:hypothetical protein